MPRTKRLPHIKSTYNSIELELPLDDAPQTAKMTVVPTVPKRKSAPVTTGVISMQRSAFQKTSLMYCKEDEPEKATWLPVPRIGKKSAPLMEEEDLVS